MSWRQFYPLDVNEHFIKTISGSYIIISASKIDIRLKKFFL